MPPGQPISSGMRYLDPNEMSMGLRHLLLAILAFVLADGISAQHTFSIVAVDPATGEVGSAGATCLSSSDCGGCGGAIIISGLVPGRGAVNAQASVCLPNFNLNYATNQLSAGASASQALQAVLLAGQAQVAEDDLRTDAARQQLLGGAAIGGTVDFHAPRFEQCVPGLADLRVVVHYQYHA